MAAFFSTQLDFILFFYGLAFILLGATCFAISRISGRDESWLVLGLFGFLHGGTEWLDLTALVISDSPEFQFARTLVMTASFVVLMEFARRELIRIGWKAPGPWAYLPLLSLVGVGWAGYGTVVGGDIARYIFGFFGAIATSTVFVQLAWGFSGFTRRFAMCAAFGFAVYGIAAGVIVPPGPLWPSSVINHDWFAHLTGVPIQLVRGMLACWLAFALWSIWGQHLVMEISSSRYTRFLRRQFLWTLGAMATILVGGWMLTEFLGDVYQQGMQREARGEIDLLASRLAGETSAVDGMVEALAGSPSIYSLLDGGSGERDEVAKSVLALHADASGAIIGFVLDRSGNVVAMSNRNADSLDTGNHQSAPYFAKSMAEAAGSQFVFDRQSDQPVYYASYPIRAEGGAVVGVAVLKKSLQRFAADLKRFDPPYFLVDPDGVVMLSNRPDMLLHNLWPLADGQRAELTDRYGKLAGRPALRNEVEDATWINFAGERDFVRRSFAGNSQWSLVMLKPIREIYASRVLGIVVTLLVALMTLIYLFGKERWFHDNVQMERRLQLQELAQSLSHQASTDPLTGMSNRLKFDQALAGEVLRAERYKTPLSLIFYDIDYFKAVNDTHGHQTGDNVLKHMSRFVAGNIRGVDTLARWGGEEFAIMLPSCDGGIAAVAAEKLRSGIGLLTFDTAGRVTCSFGVAQYVEGDTAFALVARADHALYRAKVNGRNRVESATVQTTGLASVA
jgi:diguanylate cyclase (GGDEF)-like protein